jgi:hypothetical protein
MNVDTSGPLKVQARILKPPTLKYGLGSKQATIVCNLFHQSDTQTHLDIDACQRCLEYVITVLLIVVVQLIHH